MQFLLTPLREGRHTVTIYNVSQETISTHAPAGGATVVIDLALATVIGDNFYSRPCGRGDRLTTAQKTGSAAISTHAPAGGATQIGSAIRKVGIYFYSRPCGRGDSNFPQVRHEVLRQIAER